MMSNQTDCMEGDVYVGFHCIPCPKKVCFRISEHFNKTICEQCSEYLDHENLKNKLTSFFGTVFLLIFFLLLCVMAILCKKKTKQCWKAISRPGSIPVADPSVELTNQPISNISAIYAENIL